MVINSQGDGPYAVKTTLGWTINEPLKKGSFSPCGQSTVMAHSIVVQLDELLQQQIRHDFPERQHEEHLKMSTEDHVFIDRVTQSAKMVNGDYSIGLPLRKEDAEFPSNRCVAEQRAFNLKRKLSKSPQMREDYVKFMADILEKGYAVKVEKGSPNSSKGTWYIPHHGIYHPKKTQGGI